MITLISTPACYDPDDPTIIYRWLATESPNNFRLLRNDWVVSLSANNGGFLDITLVITGAFPGAIGDAISVYDYNTESMYVGVITNVVAGLISTDIDWVTGMDMRYMNDNTLYAGYYFEGRLTVNGVVETLTVIASPDTFGYADLDVSGILRIHVSLGKTGDYTAIMMKEPTKSGNFSFEYRGAWFGSDEDWIPEGGSVSPPSDTILWYYAEDVRSEEQGSNLHEYVPSDAQDAPFLNEFDEPVYFLGLPFDLSFILPELTEVTPTSEIVVTQKIYNAANAQLGADIVSYVAADALEGFVNSLNIDEATIPALAHHMTIEIEVT